MSESKIVSRLKEILKQGIPETKDGYREMIEEAYRLGIERYLEIESYTDEELKLIEDWETFEL